MTTAPELKPVHHARRRTVHAPRPLPVWLQVGAVLLLLWNGLQAIVHYNEPSLAANTDQAVPSAPQSRFEYFYQPDRLHSATSQVRTAYDPYARYNSGNMQPTFQYSGYYAHAPSAMSVTPMRAYAASTGRWVERDPLPAK